MTGIRIEFSSDESERILNEGVRLVAIEYQRMLDELAATQKDEPLSMIKAALRSGWRRLGGDLTDPELTELAEYLRQGRRIEMRPERI